MWSVIAHTLSLFYPHLFPFLEVGTDQHTTNGQKKDWKSGSLDKLHLFFICQYIFACIPPAFEGTKQGAFRQAFALTLINTSLNAISVSRCIFVLQLIKALSVYTYNICRWTLEVWIGHSACVKGPSEWLYLNFITEKRSCFLPANSLM